MVQDSSSNDDKRGGKRRSQSAAVVLPAELDLERALDPRQAGAILGAAPITLAKWRMRGKGPPFSRIGRVIRYRLRDVLAFRDARTVGRKAVEG